MNNWRATWHNLALLLAIGGGSGLAPVAPGTCGTVLAVLLLPIIMLLSWPWRLLLLIAGFMYGCYCCGQAAKYWQRSDPPQVVWDEIIGYWIIFLVIDASLYNVLLAFGLFRILDICKPWPIRYVAVDAGGLHEGFGIMVDDLIAAIYTMIIIFALGFV